MDVENTRLMCVDDGPCDLCLEIKDFHVSNHSSEDMCVDVYTRRCALEQLDRDIMESCFRFSNNTELSYCSNYFSLFLMAWGWN